MERAHAGKHSQGPRQTRKSAALRVQRVPAGVRVPGAPPNTATIYGVYDPANPTICVYVGMTTTTLERRMSRHLASAKAGRKRRFYDWLRLNIAMNIVRPLITGVLLEEADDVEQFFIRRMAGLGHPLLNKETV